MSDLVSPISTANQTHNQRVMPIAGQSGVLATPPKGAESHAAVRPVDPSQRARDARMDVLRDVPVGPPPTFDINVLQDIRATQRDPAEQKDQLDIAVDAAKSTKEDMPEGRAETQPMQAPYFETQDAEAKASSLDLKV